MSLFKHLDVAGKPQIDWEMTLEYTFGTFESWGGKERLRNNNERFYYFFVDDCIYIMSVGLHGRPQSVCCGSNARTV